MGKMSDDFDPLRLVPQNVRSRKSQIVGIYFSRSRKLRFSDGLTTIVDSTGKVNLPGGGVGKLDAQTMVLTDSLE